MASKGDATKWYLISIELISGIAAVKALKTGTAENNGNPAQPFIVKGDTSDDKSSHWVVRAVGETKRKTKDSDIFINEGANDNVNYIIWSCKISCEHPYLNQDSDVGKKEELTSCPSVVPIQIWFPCECCSFQLAPVATSLSI